MEAVCIAQAIESVHAGRNLSRAESAAIMEMILSGEAGQEQIAGLLEALRQKGETAEELTGFAMVMRRHAAAIFDSGALPSGQILVDTCGTGGDACGTFNISTAAAFVVAGAGLRVAKHGNRSISSRCGSADVMEALGVRIEIAPELCGRAIREIGIGFLFAPAVHSATRHAMPARRQLGGRTVFNLLGPLTNPAGATAQIVGIFDRRFSERMAQALGELGTRRAFIVHGADGLDEISLSGITYVTELRAGEVSRYALSADDFALPFAPLRAIAGGAAEENAEIIRGILDGRPGPRRDIVVANAAAALVAGECAGDFRSGAELAAASIDAGAARAKLDQLVEFTRKQD